MSPRRQSTRSAHASGSKLRGNRPITKEITQVLHERVRRGIYEHAFPSEWELAREFGVSRSSARLCVDQLVREGLIYRVAGKGAFLVPKAKTRKRLLFAKSLSLAPRLMEQCRGLLRAELPHVEVQWVEHGSLQADIVSFIGSHLSAKSADLLPLDAFLREEMEGERLRFHHIAEQAFQWNGVQYALPLGFSPMVLNFHRGLFREANLADPTDDWRWNDLLAAARTLTDKDRGRFGFAVAADASLLLMFLWQCGGEVRNPHTNDWQVRSPEFRRALEFMVELAAFSPPLNDVSWRSAMLAAQTGKVAMIPHAFRVHLSLDRAGAPPTSADSWGFVRFPVQTTRVTRILSEGVGISARCKDVEDAWRLIRFLTSPVAQTSLDRPDCHLLPAALSAQPTLADARRALRLADEARIGVEHLPYSLLQDWRDILFALLTSKLSVDEAIAGMDSSARRFDSHSDFGSEV